MTENNICQYCNKIFQPPELRAHLIEKSKSEGDEESNSIVLCKKCHAKVHKKEISNEELKVIKKIGYRKRSFIEFSQPSFEFLQPDGKRIIVLLILLIPLFIIGLCGDFRCIMQLPEEFIVLKCNSPKSLSF